MPAFRDPALPFAERADDLLGRLTAGEKIAMLHQRSPAIARLAVAEFRTGCEGLHGAAWRGGGTDRTLTATVFPQPVGLGAAWDPGLAARVGRAVARETRALHEREPLVSLNLWAPVVNLLRDPRWGRNEEGYSEDPLLTARTATAFCRGLSGDDQPPGDEPGPPGYLLTAPTLKHFLAYNNERDRDLTSSAVRPRVLHEYDLPPFREPIEAGAATGVMPAYNLVNGRPNHVSPYLELARGWTGADLLVCSDAYAPSNLVSTEHYFDDHPAAHAAALRAGLDSFTDQDGDGAFTVAQLTAALERGLITRADVDRAVRRKLLIRLRLGEFDPDGGPYGGSGALDTAAHRQLARTAARACAVLLKNAPLGNDLLPGDERLLPLDPGARIAVIGPDVLYEDWYSPTMPYRVTIADGLRQAVAAAGAGGEVTVATGAERVRIEPAPAVGLDEFEVFDWGEGIVTLRATANGRYLSAREDGSLVADADKPHGWVIRETFERTDPIGDTVLLRPTAGGEARRVRWLPAGDGIAAAADAARAADVAVVVVGNDPMINGRETQDRASLGLPPSADRLIRAVRAANPRTVLVLMSSYPYAVTWAEANVGAILWTSHGGQETGHALAEVLLGAAAPAGRLAQTWYRSDDDLPDGLLDYDIISSGQTYLYFGGEPLYPFGHGLTYTEFAYSRPRLSADRADPGDTVTVTVDVTNTGGRPGEEVVQLYARTRPDGRRLSADRPRRQLCGFARVELEPGQTRAATITLPVSALACWDVATQRMTVPPGPVELLVGASSADIRQAAALTVSGAAPAPRRVGDVAAADFDAQSGITLVDVTRESRDAVAPAQPEGTGWIVFREAQFEAGERTLSACFRVARAEPGAAAIELWRADPGSRQPSDGELLATAAVPSTGDKYRWTEVTARFAPGAAPRDPAAPADLYVVLRGSQRLASLAVGG
jgi:beta-glucosidase